MVLSSWCSLATGGLCKVGGVLYGVFSREAVIVDIMYFLFHSCAKLCAIRVNLKILDEF